MTPFARFAALTLAVALTLAAALGASGCATTYLRAVVVDGSRRAEPTELSEVRVERAGAPLETRVGMTLQPGDRITTGEHAHVVVRFAPRGEVYLRPRTTARIGSLLDFIGEAFAKVQGVFAIETDLVNASVEGTQFLVRTGKGGKTTVLVFEGVVNVSSRQQSWAPVSIQAGSRGEFTSQAARAGQISRKEGSATLDWVRQIEQVANAVDPQDQAIADALSHALASAPANGSPGGGSLDASFVADCSSLTASWSPVDGAFGYDLALERRAGEAWQERSEHSTAEPRFGLGNLLQAGSTYRWEVRARYDRDVRGKFSKPLYLTCASPGYHVL
jgi:hypothetical protein